MQIRSDEGRGWRKTESADDRRQHLRRQLVRALDLIEPIVTHARQDPSLELYARIDARALELIRKELDGASKDRLRELLLWAVQIATHWQIRMRGSERTLRQVMDLKVRFS